MRLGLSALMLLLTVGFQVRVVALSVCNGSTIAIKNNTAQPLTLVKVKSPAVTLNVTTGDVIAPHSTGTITMETSRFFKWKGYTHEQLSFNLGEQCFLQVSFYMLDTITRRPSFMCQFYHAEAVLSDSERYHVELNSEVSQEGQPAYLQVNLS